MDDEKNYTPQHFIFTNNGFYIDEYPLLDNQNLQKDFSGHKWKALYEFGIQEIDQKLSTSAFYLHLVSGMSNAELMSLISL